MQKAIHAAANGLYKHGLHIMQIDETTVLTVSYGELLLEEEGPPAGGGGRDGDRSSWDHRYALDIAMNSCACNTAFYTQIGPMNRS